MRLTISLIFTFCSLSALAGTKENNLLLAAVAAQDSNLVREQLAAGADANLIDEESGKSMLYLATEKDDHQIVKLLLDAKADPMVRFLEARPGLVKTESVKKDIAKGSNSLKRSRRFSTSFKRKTLPREKGDCEPEEKHVSVSNDKRGASLPNLHTAPHSLAKSELPIHVAVREGSMEVIGALLNQHDPKVVTKKDHVKNNLLHLAAHRNEKDLLKALVNFCGDKCIEIINQRNKNSLTPLHLAVKNINYKMANYLLSLGASPFLTDNLGRTPLEIAIEEQDMAMAALLLAYGSELPDHYQGPLSYISEKCQVRKRKCIGFASEILDEVESSKTVGEEGDSQEQVAKKIVAKYSAKDREKEIRKEFGDELKALDNLQIVPKDSTTTEAKIAQDVDDLDELLRELSPGGDDKKELAVSLMVISEQDQEEEALAEEEAKHVKKKLDNTRRKARLRK